jgi:hypothetical protein
MPANFLSESLITILPTESISVSKALASINLVKLRISLFVIESEDNFSAIFSHSFKENTKSDLSSPEVTIIFLPSEVLHFAGMESLFLSSGLCI